jgi:hypothetical protein
MIFTHQTSCPWPWEAGGGGGGARRAHHSLPNGKLQSRAGAVIAARVCGRNARLRVNQARVGARTHCMRSMVAAPLVEDTTREASSDVVTRIV